MKTTLSNIQVQIDILEAVVDKYHRALKAGTELPCTYSQLMEKAIMVGQSLSEADDGLYATMKAEPFRKLMVIAKHIDDMKYQR